MTNPLQPASAAIYIFPDGRMDTANAAKYLGVSPKTMAIMRKAVFYRKDDLDAFIEASRTTSTSDYRAKRKAA